MAGAAVKKTLKNMKEVDMKEVRKLANCVLSSDFMFIVKECVNLKCAKNKNVAKRRSLRWKRKRARKFFKRGLQRCRCQLTGQDCSKSQSPTQKGRRRQRQRLWGSRRKTASPMQGKVKAV